MSDRDIVKILEDLKQLQIREAALKSELQEQIEKERANNRSKSNKKKERYSWNSVPSQITTDSNLTERVGPRDSAGIFISIGDEIEVVKRGRSTALKGKVVKLNDKTVTFEDSEGRKHWRKHKNITVTRLHQYCNNY